MASYRPALAPAAARPGPAREELGAAEYVGACVRSAHNGYGWHRCLREGRKDGGLIENELALCRDLLPWLEDDERLGFHEECQHRQCSPRTVRDKIAALERLAGKEGQE